MGLSGDKTRSYEPLNPSEQRSAWTRRYGALQIHVPVGFFERVHRSHFM